jgi:hypothetical protein
MKILFAGREKSLESLAIKAFKVQAHHHARRALPGFAAFRVFFSGMGKRKILAYSANKNETRRDQNLIFSASFSLSLTALLHSHPAIYASFGSSSSSFMDEARSFLSIWGCLHFTQFPLLSCSWK